MTKIPTWWDAANKRRQQLILLKYKDGYTITKDEDRELKMLQGIAELVMDYVSPINLKPLEDLLHRFEKLERKVKRAQRLSKYTKDIKRG